MQVSALQIASRHDKAVIVCECKLWAAIADVEDKSYCKICIGKMIKELLDLLNMPRAIEYCRHDGKTQPYPTAHDLF